MMNDERTEQDASKSLDTDYLVIVSAGQSYALPYQTLIKVVDAPVCTVAPRLPSTVRGIMNFTGEAVPLYDLRKHFGFPSLPEEVEGVLTVLHDRKRDHLRWIADLKDAVYNDKEITVQTDPHKCKFGVWYDAFKSESMTLSHYMARFEKPHKEIHALAIRSQELIARGRRDEAKKIIHDAEKTVLSRLLALFDGAARQMRQFIYEYAVVLDQTGRKVALAVDAIRYFGRFDAVVHELPVLATRGASALIDAVGRKKNGNGSEDVLVLNIPKFIEAAGSV